MVQKTMTFLIVDITACVVLDMHQTPVADQSYNVYTPAIDFVVEPFTLTPLCGYDLDYTIRLKSHDGSYSPLPSWLTLTN